MELTVIDSKLDFETALHGKEIPTEIRDSLVLIEIHYFSFDEKTHRGQLVIHRDLKEEIKEIFAHLHEIRFPIEKATPIAVYDWDDETSMQANNTSSFNYRHILGMDKLSLHSFGRAIDINPKINPSILGDGTIVPKGSVYYAEQLGAVTPEIADIFKSRGWIWGGDWTTPKDWQHFQKPL